jgi:hypothetical protein
MLCLYACARRVGLPFRVSILVTAIVWGVMVTGITEGLSFFGALTSGWLCVVWLPTVLGLTTIIHLRPCNPRVAVITKPESGSTWLVAAVGVLIFMLGVIGVIAAPSNSDSMIYHLVRVMHWMQNRSVAHYATGYLPQLYHGPWAEFAILQLQELTGGDRYAFGVQWVSMLVCAIAATVVAGQLGAGTWGQVITAIYAITLPGTVLQANSTQNNLVVSAWLLCATVALLALGKSARYAARRVPRKLLAAQTAMFGASIGLAVLTKGTGYIFGLPLVVWFLAMSLYYFRLFGVAMILFAGAFAAALNACHLWRNWEWCGSVFMPADHRYVFRTDAYSARLFASNLIKNVSLHFRWTSPAWNAHVLHVVEWAHRLLGIDVSDSRITAVEHAFRNIPDVLSEDSTGNPLHLLVFGWAVGGVGFFRKKISNRRDTIALIIAVVGGFVLFCMTVKWQMFHARLHMPGFLLLAPVVGVVFEQVGRRWCVSMAMWVLVVIAFGVMLANPSHPLRGRKSIFHQPREAQYFANRPAMYAEFRKAVDILAARRCDQIGISGGAVWEYPIWVMFKSRTGGWPHVRAYQPAEPVPPLVGPAPPDLCAVMAIPIRPHSQPAISGEMTWPATPLGENARLYFRPLN